MVVLTEDGLAVTGFVASETDDELVLREPASGKLIKLNQDDIVARKLAKTSAMPAGLVNQLSNRQQFLDLIRFLIEVNEQGPEHMAKLKKAITPK